MTSQFTGGCACGAVRYQCSTEPLAMYNCHCRDCQSASGGPFSSVLVVATDSIEITGSPKYYSTAGNYGNHATRGFCKDCGSPLFARNELKPEVLVIKAASLDIPAPFKPVADIWTVNALPWAHMDRHIPKVLKSPPVLERDGVVNF